MSEPQSNPLLSSANESAPHLGDDIQANQAPASAFFRPSLRILAAITFICSLMSIALLVATYIIIKTVRWGYTYTWMTEYPTQELAKWMSFPLVVSAISFLINLPILIILVVEVVVLRIIIPRVIQLLSGLPNSAWCQERSYPGQPPMNLPKCLAWKSVIVILMGLAAGFTLLVCIIYVVQLLLRGIAIYRTKLWETPLSSVLPKEIAINVNMKVLRSDEARGEGSTSNSHGPVYLP